MIGLSAVLLMLFNGRIAGISGIVGGLVGADTNDRLWRLAFLMGLIFAPLVLGSVSGTMPDITFPMPTVLLVVGGVLVGVGSQLGSGCTSGHGICGISRLSMRSVVATATFMTTGMLTVFFVRHIVGM